MCSRRFAFITLFLALLLASPAQAAVDFESLASQIRTANRNGSGTIILAADITLASALPAITSAITLEGNGHSISGDAQFRIFDVNGGSLTVVNATLTKGRAESGGAIRMRNGARATIESSTLRGNIAETNGGAIQALGGTLRISKSHFEKNCVTLLTSTVMRHGTERIEETVDADGCVHIEQIVRRAEDDKLSPGQGGAIVLGGRARAVIDSSTFSRNKASHGGAIASLDNARLSGSRSSFQSNQASSYAGAIYQEGDHTELRKSSFVSNAAGSYGGAIAAWSGQLLVSNSTFSENQVETSGGALAILDNAAEVDITHATFINNWSLHKLADAIRNSVGARLRLRNSIIVGTGQGEDCVGGFSQSIGNLSPDGTCSIKASYDPLLGDLTGSPAYHPPLDHSPAIDAADPRFCPETDQLGTARSKDSCDIGAIEATGAEPAPEPIVPPPVCSLADQIIAANTDRPYAGCPAGNGADTISLTRNIVLFAPLPAITSDITILGNGHTISGDNKFRIFDVDRGRLAIKNLTLMDGSAPGGSGGAIRLQERSRATVSDSSFIGNSAEYGGAIGIVSLRPPTLQLAVKHSRFIRNEATWSGGAIAIHAGSATIANSSFTGNSANYHGGAIYLSYVPRLEVTNSSFLDGNACCGGSAVAAQNGSNATLTHVTMYSRYPTDSGVELYTRNQIPSEAPSSVRLRNSIIAEPGPGHVVLCQGELTQNIGNLIEGGACSPMLDIDPMLEEPDEDTTFLAPLPGSPLIGAGHPSYCPEVDQLGNPRAITGSCDIGAIEVPPVISDIADCQVTTTHGLNFRDAPNGKRIGTVPQATTLATEERTQGWFKVEHEGATGWISADYVTTDGDCA